MAWNRIIYPHTYPQYVESGRTEKELMDILAAVHLAYLPQREGGWFTRKEWRDVLSGGEKQRVRPTPKHKMIFAHQTHHTDGVGPCLLSQTQIRDFGW